MNENNISMEKTNSNKWISNLLRNPKFNLGALVFLLALTINETIMVFSQNQDNLRIENLPGIWADLCATWICLLLYFICMLNLKSATNSMLVFAELVWISSFSAMVDGMSYIVDLQPGLHIANYLYTMFAFMTGPTLAYVFLHFVACEKKTCTRKLVNLIKICTVLFAVNIVFVIYCSFSGLLFSIEPGNEYVENYVFLCYFYPIIQLLICLVIIFASKDFKPGDKVVMGLFAVIPIFDTLLSVEETFYYSVHHSLLVLIMILMYGMLYTKRNEEMLINSIYEERKQEQERQKNMDIIEALSGDFDYVSMITLGEDIAGDTVTEFRSTGIIEKHLPTWKEQELFGEKLKLFRDKVIHKDDRDHFTKLARREAILENLRARGVHFVNFRAILNDKELYYQMKFMPFLDDNGEIEGCVVGLHNVDVETRREMETREQIERIVKVQTDELKDKNSSLNKMNEGIVELLGSITEGRDSESGAHVQNIKKYTYILARQVMAKWPEYGLTEKDINLISYLSVLHDVGKITIPDRILQKPGKLTAEEFEIMKTHCEKGAELLHNMTGRWSNDYLEISTDICRHHHEKWDGKGYPDGLTGDQIPIAAQIVAVADCYDALTSKRVYKDAYEPEAAFDMILKGECGEFSGKILSCLIECREAFISCVRDSERTDVNISLDDSLSQEKTKAFEGVKVLLVEDDELAREINTDILTEEGAVVISAEDGLDAVEIFIEDDEFDLVLMDMVLPTMDGITATRQIRQTEAESMVGQEDSVPIIVLTAQRSEEKFKECIAAGADSCLNKPLLVPELLREMVLAVKKRSDYLEEKLRNTERKANTDALTGVKNITAYTDKVSELAARLDEENLEFGIVMCDINNLKVVNDTYGHDKGDVYIKNCCRIICKVFAHSPVYRIGGDEFVVILQGNDYENLEDLMSELKLKVVTAMNIAEIDDGKASLAAGAARYEQGEDTHVGDVIKRADVAMYNNKKQMK